MIAGVTVYDVQDAALEAILTEWDRTDIGFTQRVKSSFGMVARLAGVSMIDGSTAFTVTPRPLNSAARLSVKRCTALLLAP